MTALQTLKTTNLLLVQKVKISWQSYHKNIWIATLNVKQAWKIEFILLNTGLIFLGLISIGNGVILIALIEGISIK